MPYSLVESIFWVQGAVILFRTTTSIPSLTESTRLIVSPTCSWDPTRVLFRYLLTLCPVWTFTNRAPTGCLPAAITLFGAGSSQCVARLNQDAISFNNKLNITSQSLKNNLPGLKLVVFDIYQPLLNLITSPSDSGFFESRRACCGTGTVETSVLCNARSIGTCSNATEYVFWDGFHPSEAANKVLAGDLLEQGFDLISWKWFGPSHLLSCYILIL